MVRYYVSFLAYGVGEHCVVGTVIKKYAIIVIVIIIL